MYSRKETSENNLEQKNIETPASENEAVTSTDLEISTPWKRESTQCPSQHPSEKPVVRSLSTQSFTERVRLAIGEELQRGQASRLRIARSMSISERSLQRRLQEEGTSYREILTEIRMGLAKDHLQEPRLSVGQIGHLLGYSEHSAFTRAFKRHTRMSPAEFRRSAYQG